MMISAQVVAKVVLVTCVISCLLGDAVSYYCPSITAVVKSCRCELPPANIFNFNRDLDDVTINCRGSEVTDEKLDHFSEALIKLNGCANAANGEVDDAINDVTSNALNTTGHNQKLNLLEPRCDVAKLVLNATSIVTLKPRCFNAHRIKELILLDNDNLNHISTDFLTNSKDHLTHLTIKYAMVKQQDIFNFLNTFTNLITVTLRVDGITSLHRSLFTPKSVAKITELDLADNMITKIEDYTFMDFRSLRKLNLSGNNLHSISANAFTLDLPQRNVINKKLLLDLSRNRISSAFVAYNCFDKFYRPTFIDLAANLLSSFGPEPFQDFLFSDHRNAINVALNPIVCDESVKWLLKHVHYLNYSRGGQDDDVNVAYRVVEVDGMTYLYDREPNDYSYYKVRHLICEDGRNVFERVE